MKMKNSIWFFGLILTGFFACTSSDSKSVIEAAGFYEDSRDGNKYALIKVDDLVWMNENLRYNSDSTYCYNNKETNCQDYGKLYTWNQANKACPEGWRLPTMEEWQKLMAALEGDDWMKTDDGSKNLFNKLKSDYQGLDFPLGGFYTPWNEQFNFIDTMGSYWSSEKFGFEAAMCVTIQNMNEGFVMYSPGTRSANHTCRCLRIENWKFDFDLSKS